MEKILTKEQYDPSKYNRQSTRLPSYDYSSVGAYFITICLQERQPLLENAELRTILKENWQALPQRFPAIKLDDFVIMPDHVHFILWLTSHHGNVPTLGEVIGAYKSLTGRASLAYLRTQPHIRASQFWQRGYYEHVIRNEFELQQRRLYIRNNPLKEDLKTNNQH
jgi:putative transposase